MRIPYGTAGLELDCGIGEAEVLEYAIGPLKVEGGEGAHLVVIPNGISVIVEQ